MNNITKRISFFGLILLSIITLVSCKAKVYKLTLVYNNGQEDKVMEVTKGEEVDLETPSKVGHTFNGWYIDGNNVVENNKFTVGKSDATLEAKYTINKHTYKFVNEDGTVLKEETADYGSQIVAPSNPTKEATAENTYVFVGWDQEFDKLVSDITIKATYSSTKNQYTYKFVDEDGTVLKEETADYGSQIVAPSNPVKLDTQEFSYSFNGWNQSFDKLIKDVTITATYLAVKKQYTYKFVNADNTVLKEDTVVYGTKIVAPEFPTMVPTKEYTYSFCCWDQEYDVVTEDITIKAVYNKIKNQYTYKFVDEDGTILKEEKVDYGTMPVAPSEPTKESDENYDYTFSKWDKEITEVKDDITYTAVYTKTQKPMTSLENKKISFLGDSITTFYKEDSPVNSYYTGTNQYYYPTYCSEVGTVDKTWWYQLINNTSMKLGINNSWSGSTAYGSSSSCGQNSARINTLDENGTPDIVVIYLGTNDNASGFSTDNFMSAIKSIVNQINAKYTTQIYFVTMGYSAYTGMKYSETTRLSYNQALREYAKQNNYGIIPLDEYVVQDNYSIYLKDYLHYNLKGTTLLSLVAEKAICEFNNIPFDKEIKVEHKEQLPEGELGDIIATAETGFWTGSNYTNNIYFAPVATAEKALYSHRLEITEKDGKYYVTKIYADGVEANSYSSTCDYVFIISSSHNEYNAVKEILKNVALGSIVEFDLAGGYPLTLKFKVGDGNGPETGGGTDTPPVEEEKEMLNPDGSLHVGSYNTGIWTVYETKAIAYSYDKISTDSSTFVNFNVIKLTLVSGSEYKVVELKDKGVNNVHSECSYYILIFGGTKGDTFYNSLEVNDIVVITGDITAGDCDIKLK